MAKINVGEEHGSEDLRGFMRSLLNDLHALEKLIDQGMIESGIRRVGAEQEMFLIDEGWHAAPVSMEVLAAADDPHFTTELARFNLEANLDPLIYGGDCLSRMENQLLELIEKARVAARSIGADVILTGILPTLRKSDLDIGNMTPLPRYAALNKALSALRGGPYEFRIKGMDELLLKHDSVMVESCNASFQVHFQVGAEEFASLYNIAQAVAGPVLAASTNSPLLFGRRLWRETRIALFEQAVDTRSSHDHLRDRSPRVSFGRDWLRKSVLELFREDVARFRSVLGTRFDDDPFAAIERGEAPELKALRLHNGTVYRWNRACYGIIDGKPHLRIENRVLPSGPTPLDEVANAAFWFGLIASLAKEHRDITRVMRFEDAETNFESAARHGLEAQFTWLHGKSVPAQTLILKRLIPMAREGLAMGGIFPADIDRYLGVFEERVRAGRTGARWALNSLAAMDQDTPGERMNALVAATLTNQRQNIPVARWEPAMTSHLGGTKHNFLRIEQYMTSDLVSVHEDELLDLVANLMEWEKIRHVPVEDNDNRLVGIVSYRSLLRMLSRGLTKQDGHTISVSEVMQRNPITVTPDTTTLEAVDLMRTHKVGCLPVVREGRLVGIVTERDFMDIAADLLEEKFRD